MVRLDGEGAAAARRPGRQCGRGRSTCAADPAFRTGLLFGHLPAGRLSGCRVAGGRPAAEEPLPLLAGAVVAALRRTGAVPRGDGRPFQARVEPVGAVQRLRAYRVQPFCAPLPVGQQPAGLSGRASRQLCVLHGRCLGQGRRDAGRGGRDVHRAGRAGMAQRPNLLQYGLSCRHDPGARVALRGFQAAHRHLEMQRLRPLCPQLQGVVHRREDAPDRLQPLRGLHGLSGEMPSGGDLLFAQTRR